jgi:ribonuclease R
LHLKVSQGVHEPALRRLHEVAAKLRARRQARGALDFDLPEATVLLDEDDPLSVRVGRRSKSSPESRRAYNLVEEYMHDAFARLS